MTEPSKLNIYQRINLVRETGTEFIKKLKNVGGEGYGYKAVEHDQVTDELRADLIKHGIVIEPYMVSERVVQDTLMFMGAKKNPIIRLECTFDIFFVNVDQPTDRACMRLPVHALDAGDKAPGKAVSYVVKAAMLKMFTIVTGENDEDRAEKNNIGAGLTVAAFDEWCTKIDKLSGKDLKELEDASQLLWQQIEFAVTKTAKDPTSATKLRARLTTKFSALRKALKASPK